MHYEYQSKNQARPESLQPFPVLQTSINLTPYWVYLASCANGALYVGSSANVEARMAQHNAGRGGHFTRHNRPLTLLAKWAYSTRSQAYQAERKLKRLSPDQKLARIVSATQSSGT